MGPQTVPRARMSWAVVWTLFYWWGHGWQGLRAGFQSLLTVFSLFPQRSCQSQEAPTRQGARAQNIHAPVVPALVSSR
jgi:hypothetical protein